MTRWKLEPTASLRFMHAHNRFSRLHGYMLEAAEQLGLLVGYREFANQSDGSRDREWYVPAGQLASVGGMHAVLTLASKLAERDEPSL